MKSANLNAAQRLRSHEIATIGRLCTLGYQVEVLLPSNISGVTTPDVMLNGEPWELKSPTGSGKRTIDNNLREGARQGTRVVLDLLRYPLPEADAIATVRRRIRVRGLSSVIVLRRNGSAVRIDRADRTVAAPPPQAERVATVLPPV